MISIILSKNLLGYFFETWDLAENKMLFVDSENLNEEDKKIIDLCYSTNINEVMKKFHYFKIPELFLSHVENDKFLKEALEHYLNDARMNVISNLQDRKIYISPNNSHYTTKNNLVEMNVISDTFKLHLNKNDSIIEFIPSFSLINSNILNLSPLMIIENNHIIKYDKGSLKLKLFLKKESLLINSAQIGLYQSIILDFKKNELCDYNDITVFQYEIHIEKCLDSKLRAKLFYNINGEIVNVKEKLVTLDTILIKHESENELIDFIEKINHSDNKSEFLEFFEKEKNFLRKFNLKIIQLNTNFFFGERELKCDLNENIDWFDLQFHMKFGDQEISIQEFKLSIALGKKTLILDSGEEALIPEEWKKHFIVIANSINNKVPKYAININKPTLELPDIKKNVHEFPIGMKCQPINEAQEEGYQWLMDLDHNNINGCLADDMGMGKTYQVISLLQKQKEISKKHRQTLIITPITLNSNWENEITRFSNLKVQLIKYAYNKKTVIDKKADIIVIGYKFFQINIDLIKKIDWNYLILDEAQIIKNSNTDIYRDLMNFTSRRKLCITGTPIENKLSDLWSIMNLLNPGVLGSKRWFNMKFTNKIYVGDIETLDHLKSIMSKTILRRNKKDYLKLPDKIEHIVLCDMSDEQSKMYHEVKEQYRTKIANGTSSFTILKGMTDLRLLANNLNLYTNSSDVISGKFEKIKEKIKECSDRKILIFSQYVTHLQIVQKFLIKEDISHKFLHGETKNRDTLVDNFNTSDCKVFLITLKAGGVGLNLVSAEVVFIIDPWWNPSVENQAIDRAYRFGQVKDVNVFKFITKDSIEEKIIDLQNQKKQLVGLFEINPSVDNISKHEMENFFI